MVDFFCRAARQRKLCLRLVLACYLNAGLWTAAGAINTKPPVSPNSAGSPDNRPNPDQLLIEVYQSLAHNQFTQANSKVDTLLTAYPNFQLGHLIRGDLIAMRTRAIAPFNPSNNPSMPALTSLGNNGASDRLKDLREEALVRIRAITEKPGLDLVPANLLSLSDEQTYALVMDAKRARLFVYENKAGIPVLINDYYVSQGRFGVEKSKEGDQRTPLGVYFITNRLPGAKLPDFYGPGALPLNYPNEWDKLNGRGGSGIWLHGVPANNYSRPPLASDGCVVLTNPDFLKLSEKVEVAKTPVIISEQVQFITRSEWQKEKLAARKLLDDWLADFRLGQSAQLNRHYSAQFHSSNNDSAATWLQKLQQNFGPTQNISVRLRDVAQMRYPGHNEMIVNHFTQEISSNRGNAAYRWHQYWAKQAGQWRIVFEEQNFIAGSKLEIEDAHKESKLESSRNNESIRATPKLPQQARANASAQSELQKTVEHWLNAWSSKNTKAYFAHYARDFQTPDGESRKEWMEDRRSRIEGKGKISIKLEAPDITINGDHANFKFRQHYQSGSLIANSRKTLVMIKRDGIWLIKQEKTGN